MRHTNKMFLYVIKSLNGIRSVWVWLGFLIDGFKTLFRKGIYFNHRYLGPLQNSIFYGFFKEMCSKNIL